MYVNVVFVIRCFTLVREQHFIRIIIIYYHHHHHYYYYFLEHVTLGVFLRLIWKNVGNVIKRSKFVHTRE